jgi:hypothetical protein
VKRPLAVDRFRVGTSVIPLAMETKVGKLKMLEPGECDCSNLILL